MEDKFLIIQFVKIINRINILGIMGALLLILNYAISYLFFDNIKIIFSIIMFYGGFLLFYFSLYKYMVYREFVFESKLVKIILIVQVLALLCAIINSYFLPIGLLMSVLNIVVTALFIFYGIKTFKKKHKNVDGLGLLKLFIALIFVSYITIFIASFISIYYFHDFQIKDQVYTVFIIPYLVGLFFSIRYPTQFNRPSHAR